MTTMTFTRINVNEGYNYGMDGADIVDQIRETHCFDHCLRNYKWWYTIYWWGFQVLMADAYRYYCMYLKSINEIHMSHYLFQQMTAHACMDKDYYSKSKEVEAQGTTSVSARSTIITSDSAKITCLSKISLSPTTGALKHRMNRFLGYLPSSPIQHHIKKSNY